MTDAAQQPNTPPLSEDDEWARIVAELEGTKTTEAQQPTETEDQSPPAEEAEAKVTEDAGEQPPVEEPEQPQASPEDIWANASPEQRQAVRDLQEKLARAEHRTHSDSKRVSSLQQKLNVLERQMQEQEEARQASSQHVETSDTDRVDAALEDAAPDIDLAAFREDFPEVYKAMQVMNQRELKRMAGEFAEQLDEIRQSVGQVRAPLETLEADREEQYRQGQMAALTAAHPDWRDIQQTQDFWQWVEAQTDGVKALAESPAAHDNSVLLNLYKQATGKGVSTPPPQQGASPAQSDAPERVRREPDVGLPTTRPGGRLQGGLDSLSDDQLWEHFAKEADEQLRQANRR